MRTSELIELSLVQLSDAVKLTIALLAEGTWRISRADLTLYGALLQSTDASCRVSACAPSVSRRHGKGSDLSLNPCFQTGAGTTHTVRFGSIGLGGMRVPSLFPFFEFT